MQLSTWIAAGWAALAGLLFYSWQSARRDVKQWRILEQSAQRTVQNCEKLIDELMIKAGEVAALQAQPGMSIVPNDVARLIVDQDKTVKELTARLNEQTAQARKYMDLYNAERYKPRRKYT